MFSLCCPLNSKGEIYSLCELCVSSEAGGEKYSLTYPHSKAGTISIAEGLKVIINHRFDLTIEAFYVNIVFPLEKSKTCLIVKAIRYRKDEGLSRYYSHRHGEW